MALTQMVASRQWWVLLARFVFKIQGSTSSKFFRARKTRGRLGVIRTRRPIGHRIVDGVREPAFPREESKFLSVMIKLLRPPGEYLSISAFVPEEGCRDKQSQGQDPPEPWSRAPPKSPTCRVRVRVNSLFPCNSCDLLALKRTTRRADSSLNGLHASNGD